jgi:hypothetical protein
MGGIGCGRTLGYRASAWLGTALALILMGVLPSVAGAALSSVADGDWVTNGPVYALARSGNTIYLGGSFSQVGPATGPVVSFSGGSSTPDASFPRVSGGQGVVYTAVSDGAGGWYIGGSFTHVGGIARAGLAHVEAGGSVDPSFAPSLEMVRGGAIKALALSGSTLYVGGAFSELDAQPRHGLAALNTADGSLQSWDPAPSASVEALAVAGGTLYVGGSFAEMGGGARTGLAAFTTSTGALTSWAPQLGGVSPTVKALAVSGSQVYLAGLFGQVSGQARSGFAAVDTAGNLSAWNPEASGCASTGYGLAATGTVVYVGGCFTHIGGQPRAGLAALDPTTATATSWNPEASGSSATTTAIAVSGSTVYVGGAFTQVGGQPRNGLAALDATTATATAWNPDPNVTSGVNGFFLGQQVDTVAAAGSQVLAGGSFTSVGGVARKDLAAIDTTTGEATAWNPAVEPAFPLMTVPIDAISAAGGVIYVGGSFSSVGGQPRTDLAALDPTTGTATSWNPGATSVFPENGHVSALLATAATVYAAGSFTTLAGRAQRYLGAISAASGAATSWSPAVSAPSSATEHGTAPIASLALSGTTLYVGGDFSELDGQSRTGAGALSTESGTPTSWNPVVKPVLLGELPDVRGLALSGSTVYLAAGQSGLLAVDATTGATLPWYPDYAPVLNLTAVGGITSVAAANSAVYLAGAGVDASSGFPLAWSPQLGGYSAVISAVAASGNHVYLAGNFRTTVASAASGIAAFAITGPLNTAVPTITGTAAEGQTLTEHHGSWSGSPTSYSYQWLRCPQPSPQPAACKPITGAAGSTYTLTEADAGATIIVQETATNGEAASDPVGSSATAPILARPAITSPPTVTGTPSVGQTLNCSPGSWSNSPTEYAYVWRRDFSEPISGVTGNSYVIAASDVGHDISCGITATNAAGSTSAFADAGTVEASGGGSGSGAGSGGGTSGSGSGAGSPAPSPVPPAPSPGSIKPGGPSAGVIQAALAGAVSLKSGLLSSGVYSLAFNAPSAGVLSIHWTASGAQASRNLKPVVVARGSRTFGASGRGIVKIRLTAAGRKLLKKRRIVRVIDTATFRPAGGSTQTKQATLVIRWRR